MADYRLSAKVITRSKGQSAVASAAYRAAARLHDERTGKPHDYSRRQGVLHAEIMAPDNAPDWMRDRAQLWNAVHAAEKRKDAQLAREIQLSLPHELSAEQRRELVQSFVAEQFVGRGMIADVAIHAPSRAGDERNHHAHVMLTLRELTGEGFGKKARDWNGNERLAEWREAWARHQNRELERHGHAARVDHRSFEARGIDREPTAHLGPVANDMERQGKPSRIGEENRERQAANTDRARNHIEAARLASQRARFDTWAHEKRAELEAAQIHTREDLRRRHDRQNDHLERQLEVDYGQARATINAALRDTARRLEATGFRRLLRGVTGRDRADRQLRDELGASLEDIRQREDERRGMLARRQEDDRRRLAQEQRDRETALLDRIERARERRGLERPTERAPQEAPRTPQRTEGGFQRGSPPEPANTHHEPPQREPDPPAEPSDRLGLDDKKRLLDSDLGERDQLKRPWESSTLRPTTSRPWESNLFSRDKGEDSGRERGPSRGGDRERKP